MIHPIKAPALAALLALAAGSAAANPAALLDRDGDLAISRSEADMARMALLRRLDRNGDGRIDRREVEAAQVAIYDRADFVSGALSIGMRRLDADGDGFVTTEEFRAGPRLFDLLDSNADDMLTGDEIRFLVQLAPQAAR